jgi:hypothetical protein
MAAVIQDYVGPLAVFSALEPNREPHHINLNCPSDTQLRLKRQEFSSIMRSLRRHSGRLEGEEASRPA